MKSKLLTSALWVACAALYPTFGFSQSSRNNDSLQLSPKIPSVFDDYTFTLEEWTLKNLELQKSGPSGNLRKIGERGDNYDLMTSMWVFSDSLMLGYDPSFGKVSLEHYRNFSTMTSSWNNTYRYQNSFDANGWLTQSLGQSWSGSSWVNDDKDNFTYNSLGLVTEEIDYNWNGSNWVENGRVLYSYDSNNNNDITTYFNWDNISSTWVPSFRYLYQYTSTNQTSQMIEQIWNSGNWVNNRKYNNYYTLSDEYHYGYVYLWDNVSSSWVNNFKDSVAFISPTYREITTYLWDVVTSSWGNLFRNNLTYSTTGILTQKIFQFWDQVNNVWGNSSRATYTLDGQNNYSTYLSEIWDNVSSTWLNNYKETMQYNSENYMTYKLVQTWNNSLSVWEDSQRRYFWYEANPFASIGAAPDFSEGFNLFPNPASDFASISLNFNEPQDVSVRIFNMYGVLVNEFRLNNVVGEVNRDIDLNPLPSGIFLVEVKSDSKTHLRKLIKK